MNLVRSQSRTVQAAWIAFASLVSMSVGIVTAAILSRYLSKSEYGTYRQVIYVYSTLLMFFSMGLPRAYSYFLVRVSLGEGKSLIYKLNLMFLGLSGVFTLLLFGGADCIADILKNPALAVNMKIFSITPMFLMPVLGLESIMATYKRTYLGALFTIISRLFQIVAIVFPVIFIRADAQMAVYGFVVSSLITFVVGMIIMRIPFRKIKREKTKIKLVDIWHFSFPVFTASIWGFVIGSASQFFISRYFGTDEFALFANGYMELPFVGMVIGATSTVLLPEFSKMRHENKGFGEFIKLWNNVITKSSLIIYPLAIYCCVFSKEIMTSLYGEKYVDSVVFFQIVTIVNLVKIMPYAPIMLALNRGKQFSFAHMMSAMFIVLADWGIVYFVPSSYLIAVIATLSVCLCTFLVLKDIAKVMKISIVDLVPFVLICKILVSAIICSVIVRFMFLFLDIDNSWIILPITFLIFCVLYLIVATCFQLHYGDIIKPFFCSKT